MHRIIRALLLGAAVSSFVFLAACEDDTTLSPLPVDGGGDAGKDAASDGYEAGARDADASTGDGS